jgi:hypothetical protein
VVFIVIYPLRKAYSPRYLSVFFVIRQCLSAWCRSDIGAYRLFYGVNLWYVVGSLGVLCLLVVRLPFGAATQWAASGGLLCIILCTVLIVVSGLVLDGGYLCRKYIWKYLHPIRFSFFCDFHSSYFRLFFGNYSLNKNWWRKYHNLLFFSRLFPVILKCPVLSHFTSFYFVQADYSLLFIIKLLPL